MTISKLFSHLFGKWTATIKPSTKVVHSNSLKESRSYGKAIPDAGQPLTAVKMLKVKQEKVFAPCRKMGKGGCKKYFWYLKEPPFSSKQLKVKRASWGLGLQWLTTGRFCPTSGSLNHGFLSMVKLQKASWDNILSQESGQNIFSRNGTAMAQLRKLLAHLFLLSAWMTGETKQPHLPPLFWKAAPLNKLAHLALSNSYRTWRIWKKKKSLTDRYNFKNNNNHKTLHIFSLFGVLICCLVMVEGFCVHYCF